MKKLVLSVLLLAFVVFIVAIQPAQAGSVYADYVHGMKNPRLDGIYHRGVSHGNRAAVFAKVGDSISVDGGYFLVPVGMGWANYGSTPYQETADYFSATLVREGNSFSQWSKSTIGGITSTGLIDQSQIGRRGCEQPPLMCEYDEIRPSLAIILIGSNDSGFGVPLGTFETSLRQIIEISLNRDIIPVLSTLPRWMGKGDAYPRHTELFDAVIVRLAKEYGVPWVDLRAVLEPLPHWGLSSDGVHPSAPANWTQAADLTDLYLNYGYNNRNALTLEALQQFREHVIHGH